MTTAALDPRLARWRVRVFSATWLSYAAYYFCRKPFYIGKAAIAEDFGIDASTLGTLGLCYLAAYTLGQFVSGWAGDRFGPRILVLTGMGVSLTVGLLSGFANGWPMLAAFLFVNGLAQATGWSGNVGSMAPWFRRSERGTVMGLWATNFQVGGVAANMVAAFVLAAWGWRWSFFVGSAVLSGAWLWFVFHQRNRPEDVGLVLPGEEGGGSGPDQGSGSASDMGPASDPGPASDSDEGWSVDTRINVAIVGVFYFFVKFIRYAIWSWVPFMLYTSYGLEKDDAGYLSTVFDVAGIAGVIALGVASDRLLAGRRAGLSFLFVVGMALSCVLLYTLGPSSLVAFAVCIGLIGFTLYGPDAIMTSAGAIDVGSARKATLAAGIINGMGSVGAMLQELVLGRMLGDDDVAAVFGTLLVSAVMAAGCLGLLLLRSRQGRADM